MIGTMICLFWMIGTSSRVRALLLSRGRLNSWDGYCWRCYESADSQVGFLKPFYLMEAC